MSEKLRSILLAGLLGPAAPGASAAIVINEIHYNSPGAGSDVEYVELYNSGSVAQPLAGWYLIDDDDTHKHCLLAGTLDPGAFLVVVGTHSLFAATYPGVTTVNPNAFGGPDDPTGWALGNGNDQVRLFDAQGALVDLVAYQDSAPWPVAADGFGSSLELRNPRSDNANPANWGASTGGPPPGTPGAVNSIYVADVPPIVRSVERQPLLPASASAVTILAEVTDDQGVAAVDLFVDSGSGFSAIPMLDDGLHGDGGAQDSVYGASIPPLPSGLLVRYYVQAADGAAQTTTEPTAAPAEWFAYTVDHVPPPLVIEEIVADNEAAVPDELGDFDDWVEIRNPGPAPVSLGGMFLTDDPTEPQKFALPAVELDPGARLVVWCDGEPGEGPLHASFALARAGGVVALFDGVEHGNTRIDLSTYGPQNPDVSFGDRPAGAFAPEYLATPTAGSDNAGSALFSPVCINEFLASGAGGTPDWIELHNRGTFVVDVSGWMLTDDPARPDKYVLPVGTLLAPGAHLAISELTLGFGLSATGDESILLTHSDGLTAQDWFDFGPQTTGVSQGRFPDGASDWHFFAVASAGGPNECPSVRGPGVVSELVFEAPDALAWTPLSEAPSYDVVAGDLNALRASDGDWTLAIRGCAENNGGDARSWAAGSPPPGGAWFYVVRAVNAACGFGSWDVDSPGQVGSRDAGIDAAPATCP